MQRHISVLRQQNTFRRPLDGCESVAHLMMFQKFHLARKKGQITNTTGKKYDLTTNLRSLGTTQVLLHASGFSAGGSSCQTFFILIRDTLHQSNQCLYIDKAFICNDKHIGCVLATANTRLPLLALNLDLHSLSLSLSCCSCPGVYLEVFEANRGSIIHSLSTKSAKTTSKCQMSSCKFGLLTGSHSTASCQR